MFIRKSQDPASQDPDEGRNKKNDTRSNSSKDLYLNIVIFVLLVLCCGVTGVLVVVMLEAQSVVTELQYQTIEIDAVWNLSEQLQTENTELMERINQTFESCRHVVVENKNLSQDLSEKKTIIVAETAENEWLRQVLVVRKEVTTHLVVGNRKQRAILFSNRAAFLWQFCNSTTLVCRRCPPGWREHAGRCYFLSNQTEEWANARVICRRMAGDLAVVRSKEDQQFLTNMTFQFAKQHPEQKLRSAWIGLQDMVKEGTHFWLHGGTVRWNVRFWKPGEPDNVIPEWDKENTGEDCVAIVAPDNVVDDGWFNSWEDALCYTKQHYLCEAFALEVV